MIAKPALTCISFMVALAGLQGPTSDLALGSATRSAPSAEFQVLRAAYPDARFDAAFVAPMGDYRIVVDRGEGKATLYRAGGRYLSVGRLSTKEGYRNLLYRFPDAVEDPAALGPERLERIRRFGDTRNRRASPILATSLFDALYGCATREEAERRMVAVAFLGRPVRVHARVAGALERAEARVIALAERDRAVARFVGSLASVEGYEWRRIRDTEGRSFHSMGLAVDMLPRNREGKALYWNWEKSGGNADWMLLPLSARWMPPAGVIDAMESEGFIWGGRWAIWDNIHFEYRPELVIGRALFGRTGAAR